MPSANVRLPLPLVRLPTLMPGQAAGVDATGNETGLRTHVTGTCFYVDPNAIGVSDGRDGTEPNFPLQTVAAALGKCTDWHGDVVLVMMNDNWQYGPFIETGTGTYTTCINESVVCTKHGVRIVGVCPSGSLGPIWRPATAGGTALTIHGMEVTVEGFAFSGFIGGAGGTAISTEWNGTTLFGENDTVRHCFFSDTIDIGIQMEWSWNMYVTDCVFQECDSYGIYTDVGGSSCAYVTIADNWFQDCTLGAIKLLGGNASNLITRNNIFNGAAAGGAAATDLGIDLTGGGLNIVSDNWLSCANVGGGAGDYNDFCTASATDAWINNHLMNADATTNP